MSAAGETVRASKQTGALRSAGRVLEPYVATPLQFIRICGLGPDAPIIDVSGADSFMADALLAAGYRDLTILDRSAKALNALRERAGSLATCLTLVARGITHFHPPRRYALWHDNGEFHLLTYPEERQHYVEVLQEALRPEGHAVISTYGPEAPREWQGKYYSALTLPAELGRQFELMDSAVQAYQTPRGERQQYLHCRFRRHAPH
jgi:SAM-dependent methyltransferase